MKVIEAKEHFKTTKKGLADILGLTKGAVSIWGDDIPEIHARRLHEMTRGKLKFISAEYPRK